MGIHVKHGRRSLAHAASHEPASAARQARHASGSPVLQESSRISPHAPGLHRSVVQGAPVGCPSHGLTFDGAMSARASAAAAAAREAPAIALAACARQRCPEPTTARAYNGRGPPSERRAAPGSGPASGLGRSGGVAGRRRVWHAAAMMDLARARAIADDWITAWNRHDLEAILAHYADPPEHCSPLVAERLGRSDGTIRDPGELRAYFAAGLAASPPLAFELIDVVPGVASLAVVYRNHRGRVVVEVMEIDARGKIARTLVHHRPG